MSARLKDLAHLSVVFVATVLGATGVWNIYERTQEIRQARLLAEFELDLKRSMEIGRIRAERRRNWDKPL